MRLILLLPLIALSLPAIAQEVDTTPFIHYQTALALDDKCGFFKHFERKRASVVGSELEKQLPHYIAYAAQTKSYDDYLAAYAELRAEGRATAAPIDCESQKVGEFILPLRNAVSVEIYSDLMIAVEAEALGPDQQQAAQAFQAKIGPMYGENLGSFIAMARARAEAKVAEASKFDIGQGDWGGLGGLLGAEDEIYEELYGQSFSSVSIYMQSLIDSAASTADDILFEPVAEASGYRFQQLSSAATSNYLDTLTDAQGKRAMDVIGRSGPISLLDADIKVYGVLALRPNGGIRFMTYGSTAADVVDGSFVVIANTNQLSADKETSFDYMRSQEWWDASEIFYGERVEEPCLGGPCFALPPETLTAILSGSPNQAYRFFLARDADGPMPAPDDIGIQTAFTYLLWMRQAYLDEPQH